MLFDSVIEYSIQTLFYTHVHVHTPSFIIKMTLILISSFLQILKLTVHIQGFPNH